MNDGSSSFVAVAAGGGSGDSHSTTEDAMAIRNLTAFIPPPPDPRDTDRNWNAVEDELHMCFPKDFRQLIELYGTGEFFAGLLVLNPLNSWCRQEILNQLETLRVMREAMELSLVIYPETAGLLPWGRDINGNIFCWLTEGKPDRWSVVQIGHNEEDHPHQADVGITTFLVNYGRHLYPAMLGGIRFKKQQLRFTPGLAWEP
jgi:SUKH superfamily protein